MAKINMTELLSDRERSACGGAEDWTMHKCQCGHPSCDQWTFAEMGSAGIYGPAAARIARLPDLEAAYIEAIEALEEIKGRADGYASDHISCHACCDVETIAQTALEKLNA